MAAAGGSCQEMEPAVDFAGEGAPPLRRVGMRQSSPARSALSCHPPEKRLLPRARATARCCLSRKQPQPPAQRRRRFSSDSAASESATRCARTAPLPRSRRLRCARGRRPRRAPPARERTLAFCPTRASGLRRWRSWESALRLDGDIRRRSDDVARPQRTGRLRPGRGPAAPLATGMSQIIARRLGEERFDERSSPLRGSPPPTCPPSTPSAMHC
jgi:hypothetical protein